MSYGTAADLPWADELDYRDRRTGQPSREAELVGAVFGEAITDLTRGGEGRRALLYAQTRDWMESKSVEPMSFLWCCCVLALDPSATRVELREIVPNSAARALVGLRANVHSGHRMGTRKRRR
jgi:hypothetical protein